MTDALLGNNMAKSVLQRLAHWMLVGRQILEGPDLWESGAAQEALRRDARIVVLAEGTQLRFLAVRRVPGTTH